MVELSSSVPLCAMILLQVLNKVRNGGGHRPLFGSGVCPARQASLKCTQNQTNSTSALRTTDRCTVWMTLCELYPKAIRNFSLGSLSPMLASVGAMLSAASWAATAHACPFELSLPCPRFSHPRGRLMPLLHSLARQALDTVNDCQHSSCHVRFDAVV